MKILTATIFFALAIMLVFVSAEAQERAKFPVSVSSKTLVMGRFGLSPNPAKYVDLSYLKEALRGERS
jgi:hypothetical protein